MLAEVSIEKLGLEGQGVGSDTAGNLYFVRGALPGDRVQVEFEPTVKRYRDAHLIKVVSPSPDRISSACTYFPRCGGCDWLHLSYPAQLKAKTSLLAHVLQRAELQIEKFHPILPAPKPLGYRNRIQVRAKGDQVGFLQRSSNEIVSIEKCLVAEDALNEALAELRKKVYGESLRKVELYNSPAGVRAVWDQPHAVEGFTQVNSSQNAQLKKILRSWAQAQGARSILELYCGDGNFAESLWDLAEEYYGIDVSEQALQKARARFTETADKRFVTGTIDARTAASLPAAFQSRCDTLVMDPPRSGVGRVLQTFLQPPLRQVRNIIYISCSQLTFSWDAKLISQNGFSLAELQPVDMFPQTRHLEIVARFSRNS